MEERLTLEPKEALSRKEVIRLRHEGKIFSQDMMAILLSKTHTGGTYDPTGGDGYIRGGWSEIEDSLTEGLLTDEEYKRLAVGAPGENISIV